MEDSLSGVRLNFNEDGLLLLNICLAFIMFGVALGLDIASFRATLRKPKGFFSGVISQFLLLPALTFLLILILRPMPGIALGMVLVAACPGGNVSNFFTQQARGNVALSITLTGLATFAAIVMTPLNFEVWGGWVPNREMALVPLSIPVLQLVKTVALILGLPLILGIWFRKMAPAITIKIAEPIRYISMAILVGFIAVAFYQNLSIFLEHFDKILLIVLIHNAVAIGSGYAFGKILRNTEQDSRTISIETGIQNSGLALVLIFNFFDGNGAMALIAAWWGVWHIISGFIISKVYSGQTSKSGLQRAG